MTVDELINELLKVREVHSTAGSTKIDTYIDGDYRELSNIKLLPCEKVRFYFK